MPIYLSDRGFLASRGLSYTFPGTAAALDAALPITHNLGAVPSALELWVEQSAGVWEKHDPSTYVQASSTQLISTGTTLASVLGAGTNVRLVATTGGVAVNVQEATASVPGIVSTTTQTFAGNKSFLNQVGIGTASPATNIRLHTYVGPTESYRGLSISSGDTDTTTGFGVQFSVDNTNGMIYLNAHTSGNGSNLKQFAIRTGNGAESGAARTPLVIDTSTGGVTIGPSSGTDVNHVVNGIGGATNGVALQVNQLNSTDAYPALLLVKQSNTNSTANKIINCRRGGTGGTNQGAISFDAGTGLQFTTYSDATLKTNFRPAEPQLNKILSLEIQRFDMLDGTAKDVFGCTAQNIRNAFPEHVIENEDGILEVGGWGIVQYRLAKAIQELSAKLDAAQAEIDALKSRQS